MIPMRRGPKILHGRLGCGTGQVIPYRWVCNFNWLDLRPLYHLIPQMASIRLSLVSAGDSILKARRGKAPQSKISSVYALELGKS